VDKDRKLTGTAAVAFTVVLAGTSLGACGNEVSGPGEGGQGGTSVSSGSTSSSGHVSCDPACAGVMCPTAAELQPSGEVTGSTLAMTVAVPVDYGSDCFDGWGGDPVVTVAPELGTLTSATLVDMTVEIVIELAAGTTGGEVALEIEPLVEVGYGCEGPTTQSCPLTRTFDVFIDQNGEPEITRREELDEPALERRPAMRLAFVQGRGTEATVQVQGIGADLPLSFDVTDGEVQAEGQTARWQLPERAGWYQIEAVAECGGVLATDALVVEVRPTAKRS